MSPHRLLSPLVALTLLMTCGCSTVAPADCPEGQVPNEQDLCVPVGLCDPPDCNDGNSCTDDNCNDGTCVNTELDDGAACVSDGVAGTCSSGVCEPDPCGTLDCDDGNECTLDSCEEGVCLTEPEVGTACTVEGEAGVCDGGTCVGCDGDGCVDCEDDDDCPGFCDPTTNTCFACVDNNDCNDLDACSIGVCDDGSCEQRTEPQDGESCQTSLSLPGTCSAGSCWGWGVAERIDGDAEEKRAARVAMGDDGVAIAVWIRGLVSGPILFNTYDDGWGSAAVFASDASPTTVQLEAYGDGLAIAAWSDGDGYASRRYAPVSGWSAETSIASPTGSRLNYDLTADPTGTATLVWDRFDGTDFRIYAGRQAPGAAWSSAQLIDTPATSGSNPSAVADPDGNVTAAWTGNSNRFTSGAGWAQTPLQITSSPGGIEDIGVDAGGNVYVVWSVGLGFLKAARLTPGGSWSAAFDVGFGDDARLAVDADGNALVVWEASGSIRARYFDEALGWPDGWNDEEIVQDTDDDLDSARPVVALDNNGGGVAVWRRDQEDTFASPQDIWAARFLRTTGWSDPAAIETGAGTSTLPSLAMDPSGNAVAVWIQAGTVSANRFAQ
ncbi:MAG: hypothetical protein AAF500_01160 [Myxococcota bacterium]